jgi:hypothetical protein
VNIRLFVSLFRSLGSLGFFTLCPFALVVVSLVMLTSHTHCRNIVPLYN